MYAGNRQDVTVKFANDVCSCLQKINLEASTNSEAINQQVGTCFVNSATKHQKEFRKKMGMEVIQTAVHIKQGKVNPDIFEVPELVEDKSLNAVTLPGIKVMRIKR